jgi:hypothetical protein
MDAITAAHDSDIQMIDRTSVRAPPAVRERQKGGVRITVSVDGSAVAV